MARMAVSFVAAALALSGANRAALAQATAQPAANKAAAVRRGPPRETMNVPLQAPPAGFPVPMPGGSKFVLGYESKYENARPSTLLRLHSDSDANALKDWYQRALTGQGWKVSASGPSGRTMTAQLFATRPDYSCLIHLSPAAGGREKGTDIMLTLTHK